MYGKLADPVEEKPVRSFLLLGGILLTGLGLRLPFMRETFRADETLTFLWFARLSPVEMMTNYRSSNNHILHSMLMHVAYRLFGVSEAGLRLPVLLSGVVTPYLLYVFIVKATENKRAALVAALLASVSQGFIFYSVNARGYMLQCVFSLILGILAFGQWLWEFRSRIIVGLAFFTWVLLYTIPTGLIFVVPFYGFLLFFHPEGRHQRGPVALAGLVAMTLTLLSYSPVAREMLSIGPAQAGVYTPAQFLSLLSQGIAPSFIVVMAVVAGVIVTFSHDAVLGYFLLLVLCLFPLLQMVFLHTPLYMFKLLPRSYLVLYPYAFASAAIAVVSTWDFFRDHGRYGQQILSILFVGWAFYAVLSINRIRQNPQDLFYAERPFRAACRTLTRRIVPQLQPGDRINGGVACDDVVAFYTVERKGFSGYYGIRNLYREKVQALFIIDEVKRGFEFYQVNLDPRLWSAPQVIDHEDDVQAYLLHRRSFRGSTLGPIHGYVD